MKHPHFLISFILWLVCFSQSAAFSQSMPIPKAPAGISEYIIDKENALQIDVYYGKNEKISQKVRVSSNGVINFPLVGEVKAVGLTVAQLQDKLTKLLGDNYLVDPQVIIFIEEYSTVSIMGEVKHPGSYPIKGRLTLLELISQAEGFTDVAAPNNIKIVHTKADGTKEERVVHGYQASLLLTAGDVVIVPDSTVSIMGDVIRPGVYPLKGRSTVLEVISLAGGFTDNAALNNIKVIHTKPDGTKDERIVQAYNDINQVSDAQDKVILNPGDMVIVPDSTVSIMGEVKKPGVYPIKKELTVLELISLAGGFEDAAATTNIKVIHTKPDGMKEERIVQAYDDASNAGATRANLLLSAGDMVIVPDSTVSITGEVNKPGIYPIKGRLSILELVSLAEGFTKTAAPNNIKVIHTNPDGTKEKKIVRSDSGMILRSGDEVVVPESFF
jgi:polysaccharide export outer membrane protein